MSRMVNDCVLCAEDGGTLIWKNDRLRVIAVHEPDLPGYTRVIWHAHIQEMSDLDTAQRDLFMRVVFQVEEVQREVLHPDKINLASLGNMTPHLHWHIVPRWRDDPWFPDSIWAPRRQHDAPADALWRDRCRALHATHRNYIAAAQERLAIPHTS